MAAETLKADVNEILLGYYLLGGKWIGYQDQSEVKKQLKKRRAQIGEEDYKIQDGRAKVMSIKTLKWAKENKYGSSVSKVWWTARPGVLSKAVGFEVDSKKNPTDTLVQFNTTKSFLGISAKSTAGKGDIGFKNPGIGTIEKSLSVDLKSEINKHENNFTETYNLSKSKSARKLEIRKKKNLIEASNTARDIILGKTRDSFFKELKKLSQKDLKQYVLTDWLDAGTIIRPSYIKVTGHGSKSPYTASLLDPLKNSKMDYMNKEKIIISKVGNDSIGIKAGSHRIMKMRVKYESQAMASSVKFSGDPWK